MAKMFTKGFVPKSTTKEARAIIREEIESYYSPAFKGYGRSTLSNIKQDADACSRCRMANDWINGVELAKAGCFAVSLFDQREMLLKIYGSSVFEWSDEKLFDTYCNLIGRECAAMLREQNK